MKILITGGAGFIGSHVADGFIQEGHEVVIIDNLSMGRLENVNPEATFYLMDIRSAELDKVFEKEKPEAVCHHAAQMDVRMSVTNPLFDAQVNVLGTLHLLQLCIKYGVKKFLFASTGGAVYGEQEVYPCDETHPTRPISPYGITKLTTEKYLYYFQKEFDLKYLILRYANIYGPRQNHRGEAGVIAIFTHKLLRGEIPIINGDGTQTRDYVFVGDVVQANLKGLNYQENDIFNIGTGIETDVNTLFRTLNSLTGSKSQEKHGPEKPGEQLRSAILSKKAAEKLSWRPGITLEDGLTQTVAFFRSLVK
ncbi:NAD-dependent epimerase/dehydratase family protein [bacterium]